MSQIRLERARAHARDGRAQEAALLYAALLKEDFSHETQLEAHGFLGGRYYEEKKYDSAVKYFKICTDLSSSSFNSYYDLGAALEKLNRFDEAATAYLRALHLQPNNGRYYLFAGAALYALGDKDSALALWSLGADVDPMVRQAQYISRASEALRIKSALADRALREHFTRLHADGVAKIDDVDRVKRSIWVQTAESMVSFRHEVQKPFVFYMPDLPPTPVFQNLTWAEELEKATPDILEEYRRAGVQVAGKPYIPQTAELSQEWNALKGSSSWNSIHLYENAQPNKELSKLFPKTLKALKKLPLVTVMGNPLEVFFSVLAPDTHIPPHFGLSNCRMTVHLPLVVPADCGIRVGQDSYQWEQGKIFAFDDSFNHEAWNKSDQIRVVLIFEAWAPDLSTAEQSAISASYAARDAWLTQRQIPKGATCS